MTHPMAVTACNIDMESLISDQNRSIATLAITTLLKTGSEGSVEKLLKQIGTFMSDIADDFKIVVVEVRAWIGDAAIADANVSTFSGGGPEATIWAMHRR